MNISIIVPVLNEERLLAVAIDRAWQAGADEVIVADGGSRDSTLAIARRSNCQLVQSEPGRGKQLNAGAQAANGDVFVFLHVDNWMVANGCDQIRAGMSHGTHRFGAMEQQIENPKQIFRWIESGNRWRVQRQGLIYGDQAMFIERDLFRRLGGFPEIELMEDFAFSQALRSEGKPLLLPGPTMVSARRWETSGPIRQTIRNWCLAMAFRMGASPGWIARRYRRHDK